MSPVPKGYRFSAERNAKIAASLKANPKHAARMRALQAQRAATPMPVVDREKISAKAKARERQPHSAETRAKIGAAHVGMKRGETTRRRIADARKRAGKTPATLAQLARLKESNTGKTRSAETRAAVAEAKRAYWKTRPKDERRAHMAKAIVASRQARPSSLERSVRVLLDSLGIAYEPEKQVGRYYIDVFVPSHQLAIECDGEYWHRHEGEKDRRRDAYLQSKGLTVLRLPEAAFKDGRALTLVRTAVA